MSLQSLVCGVCHTPASILAAQASKACSPTDLCLLQVSPLQPAHADVLHGALLVLLLLLLLLPACPLALHVELASIAALLLLQTFRAMKSASEGLTSSVLQYYGVAAVACTPNLLVAAILSGSFYGAPECSPNVVTAAAIHVEI